VPMLFAEGSISLFLASRCLLEKSQPLLDRGYVRSAGIGPRPLNDAYCLPRWQPVQFISGADLVLISDRLGKSQLELAGNFSHM
jgi:hypothetical protein